MLLFTLVVSAAFVHGTPAEPQESQIWETDSDAATVKASNIGGPKQSKFGQKVSGSKMQASSDHSQPTELFWEGYNPSSSPRQGSIATQSPMSQRRPSASTATDRNPRPNLTSTGGRSDSDLTLADIPSLNATGNNPRRNIFWSGERSDSDLTLAGDINIGDSKQASTSKAPVFSGNNPTREIYWNPPRDGSDNTAREQDGLMKADGISIDSKSKGWLSNTVRYRMDPTKRNTRLTARPELKSSIPAAPPQATP